MEQFSDAEVSRWVTRILTTPSMEDRFSHLSPVGAGGKVFHKGKCRNRSCGGCYPAATSPRGMAIAARRASR